MNAAARWRSSVLALFGLILILLALRIFGWWALLAATGGAVVAIGVGRALAVVPRNDRSAVTPTDFSHTLDLLRQAHRAAAGWAIGLRDGELESLAQPTLHESARTRGAALVQLASVDGRTHVSLDLEGSYVAVGDFPYGAGLLLEPDAGAERTQAVAHDLRRFVASIRLAEVETLDDPAQLVARQLALVAGGAQSLEGVGRAGAELAEHLAEAGAAVVIEDPTTRVLRVVAVSSAADRRLSGFSLSPEAPAARAVQTGVPVVTTGAEDVFGPGAPERRRPERAGSAYPLVDGHTAIGALVVLGPARAGLSVAERLTRLALELGPRLAAARAVHDAERRAVLDPLTGLRNRREFERQIETFKSRQSQRPEPVSLVYVDLDRFKALNDTLGHPAGDAALRHVAQVLQRQVRDRDLVARIGGEEFAVWLPGAPLTEGLEVAERIRRAVETEVWQWSGSPRSLTASCGVAAFPAPVGGIDNLRGAADAALYRAKQHGRNRVEKAEGPG